MATSGSGSGSVASSSVRKIGTDEEQNPLWKYVLIIEKEASVGGNRKWVCNYCKKNFVGSYTRVKSHLLKTSGKGIGACKNVTAEHLMEMKKLDEEAEKKSDLQKSKTVPLPGIPQPPGFSFPQFTSKKRKGDSAIEIAFDMQNRNRLDAEIARMFYTSGLPFNLARNPHFVQAFSFAANTNLGGYVPPGYNKLRTTLLLQEKAHVERMLEPIKSKWDKKGVTIVSDGWSDPQRRPIINFMVVSESGPMFIKSVDCSGSVKDKHFIAAKLEEVINEVGDSKVVQIITDNAANCKAAGEIWWAAYGQGSPIQALAMKLLGQPSSSSCCERNWSTYSFVHSLRRNKLAPKRAEHLVFVHNNLRLLSRNNPEHQSEKTKMWDTCGDEFGSMEDVGFLEMANLSLDEPELELFICEEVDENVEE